MNAPQDKKQFRLIGTRPVRPDGADKVTGKAIYSPDFSAPGMLHGAILRSPHPHASIRGIDTGKAAALPGVKSVVTGADFPDLESAMMAGGEAKFDISHLGLNCMAQAKALYVGHAVAAVAATTAEIAREALKLIEVDYEILPHVTDIDEALAVDAPILHAGIFTKGLDEKPDKPSNATQRFVLSRGDAAAALAGAAAVATHRFTTQPVHQGYIEPHACVASWNSDGQATLWESSQGAFDIRNFLAGVLRVPIGDIRVVPLEIGGGFGGKTMLFLEPVAMLLSKKAGRPVRLVMNRQEVFCASNPASGSIVDVKIGADADGKLVGAEVEFKYHAGAFPGSNTHSAAMAALGAYNVPNAHIVGWDVLCNLPNMGAYRAPGAPPVNFAVESCIDELAQKLDLDPIELRLKNAVRPGDLNPVGMPYGAIGLVECLEAAKAHPHYSAPLGPNQGRGVAAAFWLNYGGLSTAAVNVAPDGSVMVTTGNPDIGGSRASMAIMAAETLEVPYEKVRVAIADTGQLGYSMMTGGSRTTFATGTAVVEASRGVIAEVRARAAKLWDVDIESVEWREGAAHCVAGDKAGESFSLADIAGRAGQFSGAISVESTVNPHGYLPGFGVHICDVEVDPETGHTSVLRYTAVQDVGRAIHADYVEGQMQGGAAQGIGWALNEAYVFDKAGRMDNPGFLDYRMPVASDLPMIDTVMVEVPNPGHPYGVKGVGETPIVPPLATVANAVSRATGVRMRHLPMSPDRVYEALEAKG